MCSSHNEVALISQIDLHSQTFECAIPLPQPFLPMTNLPSILLILIPTHSQTSIQCHFLKKAFLSLLNWSRPWYFFFTAAYIFSFLYLKQLQILQLSALLFRFSYFPNEHVSKLQGEGDYAGSGNKKQSSSNFHGLMNENQRE